MTNPNELRARARELRMAASSTTFGDIVAERIELAGILEACADEIERLRKPRRVINVGRDNLDD